MLLWARCWSVNHWASQLSFFYETDTELNSRLHLSLKPLGMSRNRTSVVFNGEVQLKAWQIMQPTFTNSENPFISARLYQSHQLPPQEFEQSLNSAMFPSNGKFFYTHLKFRKILSALITLWKEGNGRN